MVDAPKIPRLVALVSGKGGSGKTMIAATIAYVLDYFVPCILVDADTGTAGLTYYLGIKHIENFTAGLLDKSAAEPPLQRIKGFEKGLFLGIGDHRRLERNRKEFVIAEALRDRISDLRKFESWVIVDCRGGIDDDSLGVCGAVDDIILVVEGDTTSFQATQHVVEKLADHGLAIKIKGFVLNKMIDDPTILARSATSVLRTQYLGAIPFDIDAVRAFIVGEIPELESVFGAHVASAFSRAYPGVLPPARVPRVWSPQEFRSAGLRDPRSTQGGLVAAAALLVLGTVIARAEFTFSEVTREVYRALVGAAFLVGLAGALEPTRRLIGQVFQSYLDSSLRLMQIFTRSRTRYRE
ncbi:MAG: ParA family protein [Deltaproteobacteria bacterium]|nr:ParA family protein [Deltaproteobacteria bacterium]